MSIGVDLLARKRLLSDWTVSDFSRMKVTDYRDNELWSDRLHFDVEFTTRTTHTSFLVGFDESDSEYPFVCQLRKQVDSIQEAYEELKPPKDKLKPGFKRQGEWFFNPVTDEVKADICANLREVRQGRDIAAIVNNNNWLEGSHRADLLLRLHGRVYAMGRVRDTRRRRHTSIVLTDWYEVLRNNEAVNQLQEKWD